MPENSLPLPPPIMRSHAYQHQKNAGRTAAFVQEVDKRQKILRLSLSHRSGFCAILKRVLCLRSLVKLLPSNPKIEAKCNSERKRQMLDATRILVDSRNPLRKGAVADEEKKMGKKKKDEVKRCKEGKERRGFRFASDPDAESIASLSTPQPTHLQSPDRHTD